MALCAFVKTAKPEIHGGERKPEEITQSLRKVTVVGQAVADEQFYRRPGRWCSMWDYLPVFLRNQKTVAETLIQLPADSGAKPIPGSDV